MESSSIFRKQGFWVGAALLTAAPFFFPKRIRLVRRMLIAAPPSKVFPFINDLKLWPFWSEWARRGDVEYEYGEPSAGTGAVKGWRTTAVDGEMRITHAAANERVAYEMEMSRAPYHIEGIVSLDAIGDATRITWLCKYELSPNPFARYRDLAIAAYSGKQQTKSLQNLKHVIEAPTAQAEDFARTF